MPDPIQLLSGHALVGTWRDSDADGETARFAIRPDARGGFEVTGHDAQDGEQFVITDVTWDGKVLRFVSRMPSTQHVVEHEFVVVDRDRVHHRFCIVDEWVRAENG